MSSNTQLKRDLLFRSSCLPVTREIRSQFITLVVKWVMCSGEEWTINRLKSIKLDIIRIRSGLAPCSSWIKSGKSTAFGGILGQLEKKALSSDREFNSVIQLLQVYSFFYAKSMTPQQRSKFLDGVLAAPPQREALRDAKLIVSNGHHLAGLRPVKWLRNPSKLVEFIPSSERRAPLPGKSVPEIQGVIDSLHYLFFTPKGRAHYNRFKPAYDSVMEGLDWWNKWMYKATGPYGPMPNISDEFLVGRIGLIQEPGYKLRAVANPGRVFQEVLGPLGDSLYRTLKALPWDCTFDQSKGIPVLQEHLSRGEVVHSIDLSGATDYFPLELQCALLEKVYPQSVVDLFSEISQGTWEMPDNSQVSWTRGQPLGLYPSFGSFALTHGILLLGLLNKPFSGEFFVLGDDVVILDPKLASQYLSLLKRLDCPVSETKTITSSSLCEFAGKIVTSKEVIPQYKWRAVSDNSFIDIVRNLGPSSTKLLRTRQQAVIKRLAPIPECLGGFGWNPDGKSLETRLNESFLWEPKQPSGRLTSYTGISIRTLFSSESYTSTLKDIPSLVCSLSEDLDQRSLALTKDMLSPALVPWTHILGKNLDQVFTSQLLECDLPYQVGRNPRSTLSVWEKKLNLATKADKLP